MINDQIELPANTFFKPIENWWKLMEETLWLRHRRHIDVGAGMGKLTGAMVRRGYTCRAIDSNTRPGQLDLVELEDANAIWLDWDDCAIIARPSHGLGLDMILSNLVGNSEVLYVGLPKNIEGDLHGHHHEIIAKDVGEKGEMVARVLCSENKYEKWCLLDKEYGKEWWIDGGDRWVNSGGGGHPKGGEKIIEEKVLASEHQSYKSVEEVCDQRYEGDGWVAPDGEHYPGSYDTHADILQYAFGITEGRAEELGFIRCRKSKSEWKNRYCGDLPPTKQQLSTLERLGFDVVDDMEELRSSL